MAEEEIDVLRHVLVPKHEIASKEEVEELIKRYKIQPHQLPRIRASDPAARAIGAQPGQIVKITRESRTAGKAIAYRYVVEG
ncbi:MAG: DNA-directed RNA polymerase subunit H [Candidatus Hadarchaeales archaeon]